MADLVSGSAYRLQLWHHNRSTPGRVGYKEEGGRRRKSRRRGRNNRRNRSRRDREQTCKERKLRRQTRKITQLTSVSGIYLSGIFEWPLRAAFEWYLPVDL